MKFSPHPYQQHAIAHIEKHHQAGLFLNMGLGKTVITLTAVSNLIALEKVHKVLVIAPLQTARNTWSSEAEKWDHLHGLRLCLILGSAEKRRAALKTDADVYIINRENTQWLCDELKVWPFDMLVVDELSSFKNPSAKRFRALRKKRPFMPRSVGLTGTPAANGYMDLWSEIYLLDRGERLGRTVTAYRNTYFKPLKTNGHIVYEWGLKPFAKDLIDNKLSDLCISMQAEDYLDVPEKVSSEVYVTMRPEEKAIYDEFGRNRVLRDADVIGVNAAAVQGKLLQMSNGFVYDDNGDPLFIHDHKLDALGELIEAAGDRNLLVYYSFRADKDRIKARFPEAVELKGPAEIKAWNEKKIRLLIAHPASAGHGLNLQDGGNIVCWFGLPWSLELYQQANARLHRQGQRNTVYIYHILTKHTHDDDVLKALNKKSVTQEELIKALKARIKAWGD